jgi:hypothetical protein
VTVESFIESRCPEKRERRSASYGLVSEDFFCQILFVRSKSVNLAGNQDKGNKFYFSLKDLWTCLKTTY